MALKAMIAATILTSALLVAVSAANLEIPANSADLDSWFAQLDTQLEGVLAVAEEKKRVITVNQDGSGDFKTVTDAVNSVPEQNTVRVIIKIAPGVYKEKIKVDRSRPFITFYGDPNAMPTLTFDGTAAQYGTVYSGSVTVEADYFVAVNIIFENSAPEPRLGVVGAQAVAVMIGGDKVAFYNCKFYGYQDTLCDSMGQHLFKDCYIQGTVDFIFGSGRSLYLNCELHSVGTGDIAITAQARKTEDDESGYSFVHCKITGTGDVFLSRAWKQMSRVVFAYTFMDSLVNPKGWNDMGYSDHRQTVYFGEYENMGPGSNTQQRESFGKILTYEEVKPFISASFISANTWLLPPPQL